MSKKMSVIDDMSSVEREIRELILHSKAKRCTVFEPCSEETLPKYLKSIEEEMNVLGVKYLFNQYRDLDPSNSTDTLVRLTNATWGLLLLHKEVASNGQKLKDRNYTLQQNNFFLNNMVEKYKKELEKMDSRMKGIEEEKRQVIVKMEMGSRAAAIAEGAARRAKSQLGVREHELLTQLRRAERENAQMKDKFHAGIFTSRSEGRTSCMDEYRVREKKYKETIAKLQENNRQLIQEVINLKEDIIGEVEPEDVSSG